MNINGNKSVFKGCEMKKKRLVLFIFFICIILFFILINTFDLFNINNNVHAVYAEEKINFDIVGNEIVSKNKKFKLIVPDNDFEEWKKYNWENEPEFSDNIVHISGKIDDVNCIKVFVSKEKDNIKIRESLKIYDEAAKDNMYTKRIKEKINNIVVYYYKRFDNIDTREAYQFVIDKGGDIFYIEGSYGKGEEEYFKRCIKQIILSIKTL